VRAQSLPDLEAKFSPAEASRLKREFMVNVLNRKADWLELHLKKLLPPHIYNMAHDRSGSEEDLIQRQDRVRKFMDKQDIRLEEHGLNARLMKGTKKISTFVVNIGFEK